MFRPDNSVPPFVYGHAAAEGVFDQVGMKRGIIVALLGLAACGGPSAPSGSSAPDGGGLPFQATRYFVEVFGLIVPCGDAPPQVGTFTRFAVNLTPDSTGWTARSEDGGFTMRLENGGLVGGDIQVRGTAQGAGDDQGFPLVPIAPTGTRMTIPNPVPVAATLRADVPVAFQAITRGAFNGPVQFSRNGLTASCPAGSVSFDLTNR